MPDERADERLLPGERVAVDPGDGPVGHAVPPAQRPGGLVRVAERGEELVDGPVPAEVVSRARRAGQRRAQHEPEVAVPRGRVVPGAAQRVDDRRDVGHP